MPQTSKTVSILCGYALQRLKNTPLSLWQHKRRHVLQDINADALKAHYRYQNSLIRCSKIRLSVYKTEEDWKGKGVNTLEVHLYQNGLPVYPQYIQAGRRRNDTLRSQYSQSLILKTQTNDFCSSE